MGKTLISQAQVGGTPFYATAAASDVQVGWSVLEGEAYIEVTWVDFNPVQNTVTLTFEDSSSVVYDPAAVVRVTY